MVLRRRTAIGLGAAAAVLAAGFAARDFARGAAFVVEAAGIGGWARTLASVELHEGGTEEPASIPWRGGQLRARVYRPAGGSSRAILVVPGVHAGGIDEPRLVGFARDLVAVGKTVVTASLPDLERYSVTPRGTDMIEDAAVWLSQERGLAPDGRIGLMGISFAGGLAIVAAGRPSIRDRVAFVMSFGGHGDLPRTLRYLCTGIQPDGARRPAHDYGIAIILLGVADRTVPADQVQPLRASIQVFLEASHLDMIDKARGAAAFEHARMLAAKLEEPARTLMGYVNDRDVGRLGPLLLPHVSALGGHAGLSPARSDPPLCPVYLLHGSDDNVIPAVESALLAQRYRDLGVSVRHLSTPLITHAEVDRAPTARAVWDLVRFWTKLLDE